MNRSRIALGALFLAAFGLQFARKDFFARLVPSYLKDYESAVTAITRVLLLVTGISFLVPKLRPIARWSALTILTSSLPDAFNQVRQPERMREAGVPPQVAAARIPVQVAVIAFVWRATRPRRVTTHI